MRLLLDSNALIWSLSDPARLSATAGRAIREPQNQIVVSIVSLWEITIKIAKGRLPELGSSIQPVFDEVRELGFETLPIIPGHLLALGRLVPHHRDPFDRMIIAQGIAERLPVATSDSSF